MANLQLYYTFEDKKYPIFTAIDANGNLSQIKGIPLKCPTCPNVPRFKDIPHLITHYGSRDHLKAANETRIRHDLGVPESVRVYTLYQLWESHNLLWRWLLETHQRKHKLNLVKTEEDEFPEYQPIKLEDNTDEQPAPGAPGDMSLSKPEKETPSHPQMVATPAVAKPKPKAKESVAGHKAKKAAVRAGSEERSLQLEPAPTKDEIYLPRQTPTPGRMPTNDGAPIQGQKRPRGRPRKYPIGSKPVRNTKPKRQAPAPKPAELPVPPGGNDTDLDIEIEFPVDPLAPKPKPLRVRRSNKHGSGGHTEDAFKAQPALKGKKYPGMAVYDFGNMRIPKNGINILITAADQQTLPFDIDGHILGFDDNGGDSILIESLDEVDGRPGKRTKKDDSDESFNFSTSTSTDQSNAGINVSTITESAAEDSGESIDTRAFKKINEDSREDITGINSDMEINRHAETSNYNDMIEHHPSFAIFEDESAGSYMDDQETFTTLETSKRLPLHGFGSTVIHGSDQQNPRPMSKNTVLNHGNNGHKAAKDIHGVDLYSSIPFAQLDTEAPVKTFSAPVLPRLRTVRTYEGLSLEGSALGWQGSFIPTSQS